MVPDMTIDGFMMVNLNNRDFIPNSGERPRQGDTISTAFVNDSKGTGNLFSI